MASQFDSIQADDFERRFECFKEEVLLWPHGRRENSKSIKAIVERDARNAGGNTTHGGLADDQHGKRTVQPWLIELSAAENINPDDVFVIDGQLRKVRGEAIGSDGGSVTYVIVFVRSITSRQSRMTGRG